MTKTAPARQIVLGSRNKGKTRELAALLAPHSIAVLNVADFPDAPEVVEDGETFAENAQKKASQLAKVLSHWVLAEDSGLAVDALGGAPGVYSARYSGEDATDDQNNAKLLTEMAGVPSEKRGARFVCNMVVADPSGAIRLQVEASCRGRIAESLGGGEGFGYDPLFVIPEYHHTFGDLGPAVKRVLSHRGRAFRQIAGPLVELLRA
jgi:XTP/dITP diphosphohydrolase